jgi:hypothetical protein
MPAKLYQADRDIEGSEPSLWPSFVGVDEGLDQLFRWSAKDQRVEWMQPLKSKCRSLQRIAEQRILAVHDAGFVEIDLATGAGVEEHRLEAGGVISAIRLPDGGTVLAGLKLNGRTGVGFVDYDSMGKLRRTVNFPGDYVRCCSVTDRDTVLYTANTVVYEADWSGKLVRTFQAEGFYHAWKPLRLPNGTTRISAGYGAFLVEFDEQGREQKRWTVPPLYKETVHPFFFSDFVTRENGNVIICNWLGHGGDRGRTGYSLLEFDGHGEFLGAWQDARGISSLQTFLLC